MLALTGMAASAAAAEIYVASGGNDANPGTLASPLATIQAAVDRLQPGDTGLVRGGTYRETVTFPRSGTAAQPITLKAYRNERVTVSGCDVLAGWKKYKNNIWMTAMPWTLGLGRNQVFGGGQVMIEARYPNVAAPGLEMFVAGLSPLWPTYGEFSIPKETRVSQPGRITSTLLDNQPADYWQGGLYCGVHFEGWCAQTGVIESSKAGEIQVGDRTQGWWFGSAYDGKFPQEHEAGRGMIVGHLHALDMPGEWHWQDNTLYLIAPRGGEPKAVEAKRRQLAFELSGREHIRLAGISVSAASMRLENSAHCTVERGDFAYISHYTRHYGIGQIEHGRDTIKSGETGIYLSGHDNAFLNTSIRFSAGTGFHIRGYHHTIHNCLIDEVSYVGHYLNAITDAVGGFADYEGRLVGGHVITYNTMRNAGRHFFNFYGNGPSLESRDRGPMDYAATLFTHNHLYNGMLLTRDAGFITSYFASGGTLNGQHSQVAYNVMHDCYDISAMRWNKLGMVYLDNGSREVDVHHNLLWAAPGSLQSGIWFNPPNINVSDHDNVFRGLFTRTSAQLVADDFPNGQPFRFGHDFAAPPVLPAWPQLATLALPQKDRVTATVGLKDGDCVPLGEVDFNQGWQSAVMRLASAAKTMNTDRSMRAAPRHQKPTDPLVLDAKVVDGSAGLTKVWTVFRAASGGWMRFNQVPLGGGYLRFRAVYGTTAKTPRHVEVHLDQPDGLLVGQASLHATDRPRAGSIQMFEEAVGELAASATGTHDLYFVLRADDGQPVAEIEYFRLERARTPVALQKNDVRLELRIGNKNGAKIGEFIPRFTGGNTEFLDWVTPLEPTQGIQPLVVVVRSALPGTVATLAEVHLQKSQPPGGDTNLDVIPLRTWQAGGPPLPAATNRPCASPADRYRETSAARPFQRATRFAQPPVIDGVLTEWTGRTLELKQSLEGAATDDAAAQVWVGYDAQAFYVAMRSTGRNGVPLATAGHRWGDTDGFEIAFQSAEAPAGQPVLSLHGWPDGYFRAPEQAGISAAAARKLAKAVTYRATTGPAAWTCEWRIPFEVCGGPTALLNTNFTVRNLGLDLWRTWHTASGATYDLHNGGTLICGARESTLPAQLTAALEVWLDASDASLVEQDAAGAVSIWKDKSGKGRHAVQAQAKFRPHYLTQGLNGMAALRFDDAQQTRLELPDLSDHPLTATIIAVVSNPDPGLPKNQNQRIFTASNGKEYDYLSGLNCYIPAAQTGGPRQIVFNGKDRWAKHVRVGCFSPNDQTFFNGRIAEILVFGRALTKDEQFRVMAYLTGKWEL